MIPILYEGNETQFNTNGLGRLADAITCEVTEERNATYELVMTYPITGIHYNELQENRIILAQPFDGGLTQPFIIYKISRPLNGIVTVNAEHISYRLTGITVMPFEASTAQAALAGIDSYSATSNPFNFTTDKTTTGSFKVKVPTSARALLCGQSGSVLDVFGSGDYEFNRFDVNLRVNRGTDNGVTLRYAKNLTDLKSVIDTTNVYTGISPFWTNGEGTTVTLPEKVIMSGHQSEFPFQIIKPVDFSSSFQNEPTIAELRAAAQSYVARNEGWKVKNNITVSFVALWNTEEYKDIAPLERVKMCDIVHVIYSKLGVNFDTKVIKTVYNVLLEKYNSITLGDTQYTLSGYFNSEIAAAQEEQTSHMQKAIARATKLIQGGLGGHVVFNTNADGEPNEILIMDTDDISTAVNVIRMNLAGIGFSTSGYNGPFNTAWTIDGHFVADYIDTGTLNADLIKVGMLQDEAGLNYWNMVTGDFRLTTGAKIGNSTIASAADVSSSAASTLSSAHDYADAKGAAVLSAAELYTNNGITTYDQYLDQTKVFNKLTNNGAAQGIYLSNGELYINGTYIKTGTLDASLVNVTNLNAANITTGTLQDAYGNTAWDLVNGTLSSKNLSIDSTYFKLASDGKITSIAADGKKMEFDKGTITGFKSNGDLSAKLEIGDGYFNIANGVLAIQGVVGVSGSTSFVKGISYENETLGTFSTTEAYSLGGYLNYCSVTGGSVSLSGGGIQVYSGGTASGQISVSGYVNGQYVTLNGNASLNVTNPDIRYTQPSANLTNPQVTISGNRIANVVRGVTAWLLDTDITYAKAVSAENGSINSQYGIIQSIS